MKNLRKISVDKGIHHPAPFCSLLLSLAETKIIQLSTASQTTWAPFYYVKAILENLKSFAVAGFALHLP